LSFVAETPVQVIDNVPLESRTVATVVLVAAGLARTIATEIVHQEMVGLNIAEKNKHSPRVVHVELTQDLLHRAVAVFQARALNLVLATNKI
jgi:hypothetical protein